MDLTFSLSNANTPATMAADTSATITNTWNNGAPPQPTTDFSQTLQDQTDKFKSHHAARTAKKHHAVPTSKTGTSATDAQSPAEATSDTTQTPAAKDGQGDANNGPTSSNTPQLDPNHAQSLVAFVDQTQLTQPAAVKTPTANATADTPPSASSTVVQVPVDPTPINSTAAGQGPACNAKTAVDAEQKAAAAEASNATDETPAPDTETNEPNTDSNKNLLQRAFPSIKLATAKHAAPTNTTADAPTESSPASSTTEVPPTTTGFTASSVIPLPAIVASTDLKATAPAQPVAQESTVTAVLGSSAPAPTNSATVAATAQQSPASAHENVLDQVIMGLQGKLDPQNGKAEIRLDPPNLGSLRVSINLNKGTLTAQFSTSTDMVRDLLSNHMDKLRTVLENQGITVDRLAVQTTQPEQPQPQAQDQQNTGSSNHDGRSAGGYEQKRPGPQQDSNDLTFASTFAQAREEAPIDVLA